MMPTKPLISLYDAAGLGVIVLYPSGVLYSNQVGGVVCRQPEVEGVYVPLVSETVNQQGTLYAYFSGPKWGGGCANGIDEEDAETIDRILDLFLSTRIIKVDRSRLKDSCEAWVYVKIAIQPEERPVSYAGSEAGGTGVTASGKQIADADYDLGVMSYPFYGFGNCTGILTWQNSD